MRPSVPGSPVAIVSCHLEEPLRDDAWTRFDALRRRRPGGFDVIALMRPPDPACGEDVERWLLRARAVSRQGPFGLHTHWTSPSHARPTGGDPLRKALFLHNAVLIDDKFMQAVETDSMYDLLSPRTSKMVKQVKARDIWIRILTCRRVTRRRKQARGSARTARGWCPDTHRRARA